MAHDDWHFMQSQLGANNTVQKKIGSSRSFLVLHSNMFQYFAANNCVKYCAFVSEFVEDSQESSISFNKECVHHSRSKGLPRQARLTNEESELASYPLIECPTSSRQSTSKTLWKSDFQLPSMAKLYKTVIQIIVVNMSSWLTLWTRWTCAKRRWHEAEMGAHLLQRQGLTIYGHGSKQKLAILSSCVFLQPTHQPCSIILRIWSQKCWEHNPAENGLGANAHQGSNHHKESGCHTKATQAQHKDSILGICKSWQGMKFMKSKQNLPKINKSVSLRSPFCCEKVF